MGATFIINEAEAWIGSNSAFDIIVVRIEQQLQDKDGMIAKRLQQANSFTSGAGGGYIDISDLDALQFQILYRAAHQALVVIVRDITLPPYIISDLNELMQLLNIDPRSD